VAIVVEGRWRDELPFQTVAARNARRDGTINIAIHSPQVETSGSGEQDGLVCNDRIGWLA
jgi:hypothetical protein